MGDFLSSAYPWILSLHLVSVISWMVGLLYLPRLFVYHCDKNAGSEASEMLKVMEQRLLRFIMTPAMIASLVFGFLLASTPGIVDWTQGWFYIKILFLLALFAFHGIMSKAAKRFARDENTQSPRYFRMMNEVPTLLMIGIIIFVIVKPF